MLVDVERSVGETEAQTVDYTVAASGKLALLDRMLPRLQVGLLSWLVFVFVVIFSCLAHPPPCWGTRI